MNKDFLRTQMLKLRNAQPPKFLTDSAMAVGGVVSSLEIFCEAKTILFYMDFQKEIGTGPLLSFSFKKEKKIVLPLTDSEFQIHLYYLESEEQLVLSPLGILEPDPLQCKPCDPKDIDLLIIPGVAFDISGNRLGYGKGCYDRLLTLVRPDAVRIGLAYDFQVLPHIPSEPLDLPMDAVVTEKGLLNVRNSKNIVNQTPISR